MAVRGGLGTEQEVGDDFAWYDGHRPESTGMDQMGHPFVSAQAKTATNLCESMSGMDTERSESIEAYGRWEGTEFVFTEPLPLLLGEDGHVLAVINHQLVGPSNGPAVTDRGRLDNDEAVD